MALLLNLVYLAAILFASPWLIYSALWRGKYREGWPEKFWGRVPQRGGDAPCLWLHAVSVGEVNLLRPLLDRWEQAHPDWECVISTTTPAGYALAQKRYAPRMVFYCPLDFSWAVAAAMRRIRPNLLVLAELELWPNLIAAAGKCGAKVAVINGRLGQKSFRGYRWIGWFVRRVLGRIDLVAAQNEEYAQRFRALGASSQTVQVTGSMKFDGATTNRENPATRRLAELAGVGPGDVVWLAGSTQQPEEALALQVFQRIRLVHPQLRLILVPRHTERFEEVARLLDQQGVAWQRRSHLEADGPNPQARVLLVDAVGELGAWWGLARIAFVGGTLGNRGGQNMIEPAAYGAAVSFGPNTWNFRDVVALLLDRQAAQVVHDAAEMDAFTRRCLTDPDYATALGTRAQALVAEQLGAADRTCKLLSAIVKFPAVGGVKNPSRRGSTTAASIHDRGRVKSGDLFRT